MVEMEWERRVRWRGEGGGLPDCAVAPPGRSAGTSAKLISKDSKYATLRLPSGEIRMVLGKCKATIGEVRIARIHRHFRNQHLTLASAKRY